MRLQGLPQVLYGAEELGWAAVMKPYIVIVHKDPESAYGMTFPDAPGCFSAVDELDDLFANAAEALSLWTEEMQEGSLPIPAPRDFADLRVDPQWTESFADAALIIAVPPPDRPARKAA
jgi:predicted RNase H-like HicB family nuclease